MKKTCVLVAVIVAAFLTRSASASDDRLSPDCVAILSDEVVDELDQDHSVCPDASGKVSLREGGTREINGIPNLELEALFADAEEYGRCRDVFVEPPFENAIRAIAGASNGDFAAVPDAMAKVFRATVWAWRYFEPPRTDGFTIYACVDLAPLRDGSGPATVNLYKTMCGVSSIYNVEIGRLNLGTRFVSVATHEIGHVIDELSGCSGTFSADAEMRATVYGLFIAECHARRWQSLYAALAEDPPSSEYADREPRRQLALHCLQEKWAVMERQIAALRRHLVREERAGSSTLLTISACSFAADPGVAAPRLESCPTEMRR